MLSNITTKDELYAFPEALIKNLDDELLDVLNNVKINGVNALSLLPKNITRYLLFKKFTKNENFIKNLTVEQLREFGNKNALAKALIKSEQIYNLNPDAISEILITADCNVVDILNHTKNDLKTIKPEVFSKIKKGLNDKLLSKITPEQSKYFTDEFIKNLIKNGKLVKLDDIVLRNLNFNFNCYNGAFKNLLNNVSFGFFCKNLNKNDIFNQMEILYKKMLIFIDLSIRAI